MMPWNCTTRAGSGSYPGELLRGLHGSRAVLKTPRVDVTGRASTLCGAPTRCPPSGRGTPLGLAARVVTRRENRAAPAGGSGPWVVG